VLLVLTGWYGIEVDGAEADASSIRVVFGGIGFEEKRV
jgi:hypothetical protein